MNERWIVTGANGYLGSELCKELQRLGKQVHGLVRQGKSTECSEGKYCHRHTYEELPTLLHQGDIIVHCAGKVGSTGDWEDFKRINVDWTASLYNQAAKNGTSCFIYVSSVAAIGYKNRGKNNVLDELSQPELLEGELYGRSKLIAEQTLLAQAKDSNTRLIILRPGLIYGRRPFSSVQTWLCRGVIVDPSQRVPLVHIDSFLDAVFKVVKEPNTKGVFFVVDEEQPALSELNAIKKQNGLLQYRPWYLGTFGFALLQICKHVVRKIQGKHKNFPKGHMSAERCFQKRNITYNTNKLRSQVGWFPKTKLIHAIQDSSVKPSSKAKKNRSFYA